MNHPRRLLFLVPFALLGTALLVRARLPRPHEGDKWLWEVAETTTVLHVGLGGAPGAERLPVSADKKPFWVAVSSRAGMRALLRTFEHTGPLTPETHSLDELVRSSLIAVYLESGGATNPCLLLCQKGPHYSLHYDGGAPRQAAVNAASVARFLHQVRETTARAKRRERGYTSER